MQFTIQTPSYYVEWLSHLKNILENHDLCISLLQILTEIRRTLTKNEETETSFG